MISLRSSTMFPSGRTAISSDHRLVNDSEHSDKGSPAISLCHKGKKRSMVEKIDVISAVGHHGRVEVGKVHGVRSDTSKLSMLHHRLSQTVVFRHVQSAESPPSEYL